MCKCWTNAAGVTVFLVFSFVTRSAWTAEKQSDNEITQTLIGSWIVPPDSSDARPDNTRALGLYHPDGTATYMWYSDHTCSTVVRIIEVAWKVKDGILTSVMQNGYTMKDEVVSIGPKTLTLHSLDDGTTYTRVRAKTCSVPVS